MGSGIFPLAYGGGVRKRFGFCFGLTSSATSGGAAAVSGGSTSVLTAGDAIEAFTLLFVLDPLGARVFVTLGGGTEEGGVGDLSGSSSLTTDGVGVGE